MISFSIWVDIAKKIKNAGITINQAERQKASAVISTRNLFTSRVEITTSPMGSRDIVITTMETRARSYNTVPDMNRSSEVVNVRDVEPRRDLELRICVLPSGYIDTLVHTVRNHTARSYRDDALSGSPRFANLADNMAN